MCRLFETIRIENGLPQNLERHERRMVHSRRSLWGINDPVVLKEIIHPAGEIISGIVRCNVFYGKTIESVTFSRYHKRHVRTLKLVDAGDLNYSLKYSDRRKIEALFSQRGSCDEIILVKEGLITDTSISNLIFFDGKKWYTPQNALLNGTCRQKLLDEGTIHETTITVSDIGKYAGLKMINALRFPDEEVLIPVSQIQF